MKKLLAVLLFILMATFPGFCQQLSDLEATGLDGNYMVFDYQLHRNPAYIYRYLYHIDSTKHYQLTHLYRGNVIYGDNSAPRPSHRYKIDVQLEPYYNSRFGDEDDPFKTQIGVGPKIQLNSKYGFYGMFQWLIPLQNDFDTDLGYGPRPGELGVGYTKILRQQHHLNVFAGTFTNSQYGLGMDYVFRNRTANLYFGGSTFYTAKYIFIDNRYTREQLHYISGNIFVAYHFKAPSVTFKLSGERYLYNDYGIGFEVYRQFGNTDIGFYALQAKNGENVGFKVAFALWPRKFYNNSWMQIRFPHTLRFQYDLKNANRSVNQVRNQTDFFYEILRFNPYFINKQL